MSDARHDQAVGLLTGQMHVTLVVYREHLIGDKPAPPAPGSQAVPAPVSAAPLNTAPPSHTVSPPAPATQPAAQPVTRPAVTPRGPLAQARGPLAAAARTSPQRGPGVSIATSPASIATTTAPVVTMARTSPLDYNPVPMTRRVPTAAMTSSSTVTIATSPQLTTTTPSLVYNPTPSSRRPISAAEQAKQDFLSRTSPGVNQTPQAAPPETQATPPHTVNDTHTHTVSSTTQSVSSTPTGTIISSTVHTQQRTTLTSKTVTSGPPSSIDSADNTKIAPSSEHLAKFNSLERPGSAPSGEYLRIQKQQQNQEAASTASDKVLTNTDPVLTNENHSVNGNISADKSNTEVRLIVTILSPLCTGVWYSYDMKFSISGCVVVCFTLSLFDHKGEKYPPVTWYILL